MCEYIIIQYVPYTYTAVYVSSAAVFLYEIVNLIVHWNQDACAGAVTVRGFIMSVGAAAHGSGI